jgi:hypothetical protein
MILMLMKLSICMPQMDERICTLEVYGSPWSDSLSKYGGRERWLARMPEDEEMVAMDEFEMTSSVTI